MRGGKSLYFQFGTGFHAESQSEFGGNLVVDGQLFPADGAQAALRGRFRRRQADAAAAVPIQMVLPFPVMSEEALVFADGNTILMTHGHIWNEKNRPEGGYTHFFSGHTHLQVLKCESGIVFLNPGSITLPKGGTERSYATYIDEKIAIRRMSDSSVILEI